MEVVELVALNKRYRENNSPSERDGEYEQRRRNADNRI
ncbi:Uncharacterized protein BM_BM18144 [Brugia malayi]|nr:Uncharacterized protein BM_BM18144 [Brugia malayi]VIP00074.1 Uncharacterized protein BM_BM18144 [Brugia malayi]